MQGTTPSAEYATTAEPRDREDRPGRVGGRGPFWWRGRGRSVVEGLVVGVAGVVLAVVHTWPLARTLRTTVPGDTGDPMLISWQLAWAGRLLRGGGGDFWTTPAFMGTPDNLAFTDVTLGYAPLTFVSGEGFTGAVVQMNLAVLVAAALAFVGGYVLARVIGARVPGALVAGAALAFAPWRSGQVTHLNVYSIGGIALALGLLVRGHGWSARGGFRRDRVSAGWVLAGWVVAAWQL